MLFLLLACSGPTPGPLTCEDLLVGGPPATDESGVADLMAPVREHLFPELDGVHIGLNPNQSDSSYFSANLEIATIDSPPPERRYLVHYSVLQFDDPPPADAVRAIMAHELKHVRDYTEMSADELVEFGVRYATEPISEYERQTDLHALELGCGRGLIQFREWLYDHVTDEVEAQKRVDYFTPEEIEAWMAANP